MVGYYAGQVGSQLESFCFSHPMSAGVSVIIMLSVCFDLCAELVSWRLRFCVFSHVEIGQGSLF